MTHFILPARRAGQSAGVRAASIILLLVLPRVGLGAQRVVPTLDVGGSRVRYADNVSSSAATLSPAVRADWDRATLVASGSYSQFAGGSSTQGMLGGSTYAALAGPLTAELGASLGGSVHADGARTGQGLAVARAHLMGDARGAWVGAGIGSTSDGADWRGVRMGEVAAWARVGAATLLGSLTPTQVADTIRYADTELAARWELARGELGFSGGLRSGDRLPSTGGTSNAWGSVSAIGWLAPRAAVVLSGGSYPVDFTQGFPGGRFVSVAVRFGPRATSRFDGDRPSRPLPAGLDTGSELPSPPIERATAEDGVLSFGASAAGAGCVAMRVHAPRAAMVEVTGDFTEWQPVKFASAGAGWWTATLPVRPGAHEMNVRVDGGRWLVPPGLTAVREEFGGSVGVLIVP